MDASGEPCGLVSVIMKQGCPGQSVSMRGFEFNSHGHGRFSVPVYVDGRTNLRQFSQLLPPLDSSGPWGYLPSRGAGFRGHKPDPHLCTCQLTRSSTPDTEIVVFLPRSHSLLVLIQ